MKIKIAKSRVKQIIKEELDHIRRMKVVKEELDRITEGFLDKMTKTPDASERFPHGDIYDVWVGVGDEVKAVNERFFKVIADDYYYVLELLKNADDPKGALWQDDNEDSGYAPDLRFPKLTSNQQDAIGHIGRVKRDIHRLIKTTSHKDKSYGPQGGDAAWEMLSDHKLFDFVSQWVKELDKPVDYTGKP